MFLRSPVSSRSPITTLLATSLVSLIIYGCSKNKDLPYVERPPETIYAEGASLLKEGKIKKAAKTFEEVERQHPYSPMASKAMLMSIYAYFECREYDLAIASAENFIHLHPGNPDVSYAYYMIAMSLYDRISSVEYDQKQTENARIALTEVIRRFPESAYARDCRLKMALVRDHLAGKSVEVGRYYLKTHAYLSALNRFQEVVESYQDTIYIEEALYRLMVTYIALGIKDQALSTASVLGHSYPSSAWYKEAHKLITTHYPDTSIDSHAQSSGHP